MKLEDTDAPTECPECGKEATAILLAGDEQAFTMVADSYCKVPRSQLPRGVGWVSSAYYIHTDD